MDNRTFDDLTRALGKRMTRREFGPASVIGIVAGLAGSLIPVRGNARRRGVDRPGVRRRRRKCRKASPAGQCCTREGICSCDNGGEPCGASCCTDGKSCENGRCVQPPIPGECIAAGQPCAGLRRRCCDGRVCGSGQGGTADTGCWAPTGGACRSTGDCVYASACVDGMCMDRQPEPEPDCIPTTCAAAGVGCGSAPDRCGGTLDCGACLGGKTCTSGACACPAGQTDCGGTCVDTSTSAANCGGCAPPNGAGAVCAGGTPVCVGGICKACLAVDDCGASANACAGNACVCSPAGAACSGPTQYCVGAAGGGACRACRTLNDCTGGKACCDGACVDLQTDTANCGTCGNACSSPETCGGGTCARRCAFTPTGVAATDGETLRALAEGADGPSTILLCPGTYQPASEILVQRNLTIEPADANAAASTVVIDGGWSGDAATDGHQVFLIGGGASTPTVELSRIVVRNGRSVYGGGIRVMSGARLALTGVSISGCTATTSGIGGGILVQGSTSLTGVSIENCSAFRGGGIYADGASTSLTVVDGNITGCAATNSGGGFYNGGGAQASLTGCTISGCSAYNGGGIYNLNVYGEKLSLNAGVTISGNFGATNAAWNGIYSAGATSNITCSGSPKPKVCANPNSSSSGCFFAVDSSCSGVCTTSCP